MGKTSKSIMVNLPFKHHENECCGVECAPATEVKSYSVKYLMCEVRGRTEFV